MKKYFYLILFLILTPLNAFSNTTIATQQQNTIITTMLFFLVFILMYFMLIKPQLKKEKNHKKLLDILKEKTEVITVCGLVGTIKKMKNNYILLETNNQNTFWIVKTSIVKILPDATIKNLNYEN